MAPRLVHDYLLDENDREALDILLSSNHSICQRKTKTKTYFVIRSKSKEITMARWVAERMKGTPLLRDERVTHVNGDHLDCQRANLTIKAPQGVRKGTDVAWIVRIKSKFYICISHDDGEKDYIRVPDGRDPKEFRQEWYTA